MRLIDADDIYRYVKEEINPYGKPFEGSAYELGLKIMEHIERMSTAYDVDKVMEELKEARFPITDLKQGVKINGMQQTDDAVLYSRAQEIVKAGGTND